MCCLHHNSEEKRTAFNTRHCVSRYYSYNWSTQFYFSVSYIALEDYVTLRYVTLCRYAFCITFAFCTAPVIHPVCLQLLPGRRIFAVVIFWLLAYELTQFLPRSQWTVPDKKKLGPRLTLSFLLFRQIFTILIKYLVFNTRHL